MSRSLFLGITNVVDDHDNYFVHKRNTIGILGLSCYQKVTATICQLAYGIVGDALDEYIGLGESTAIYIESLRRFVKTVIEVSEHEFTQ